MHVSGVVWDEIKPALYRKQRGGNETPVGVLQPQRLVYPMRSPHLAQTRL